MTRFVVISLAVAMSTGCPREDTADPATPESAADWSARVGPCQGSQTNALHFDDTDNGYIGCGENADGVGLHQTSNGGQSWTVVEGFEQVRVSDIRRGPEGALLIAGKDTTGPAIAYRVADAAEVLLEYAPAAPFMRIGHAENVVIKPDGAALVDSLTGRTMGYRAAGETGFVEVSEVAAGESIVVRRLGLLDGAFFGVGGSINDAPQVYLESTDGAPEFTRVDLGDGNNGELYAFTAVDGAVLVAGWDQTDRHPLLFRGEGDLGQATSWARQDLRDLIEQGAIRDLCRDGQTVVAVGERFPTRAGGFALHSTDGGESWADISPDDAAVLSRCHVQEGRVFVAGASGYAATLDD